MSLTRTAETINTVSASKLRHSATVMISAVCILATFLIAGCGGGGGGGSSYTPPAATSDTTPPVITLTSPASGQRIDDVVFVSSGFYVQFSYSDASAINLNSRAVYMQMDGGTVQDISGYISQVTLPAANTYQINGLHNYTRTLFNVTSNTTTHTINISIAARDSGGNLGRSATTTFIVPPAAPPQ